MANSAMNALPGNQSARSVNATYVII